MAVYGIPVNMSRKINFLNNGRTVKNTLNERLSDPVDFNCGIEISMIRHSFNFVNLEKKNLCSGIIPI